MNSCLEHVFTARPVAEERIPASFDAISPVVDVSVVLSSQFWFFAGKERVGNPWQMTKNKTQLAAFFSSSHLTYVCSTLAILRQFCFQFLS